MRPDAGEQMSGLGLEGEGEAIQAEGRGSRHDPGLGQPSVGRRVGCTSDRTQGPGAVGGHSTSHRQSTENPFPLL